MSSGPTPPTFWVTTPRLARRDRERPPGRAALPWLGVLLTGLVCFPLPCAALDGTPVTADRLEQAESLKPGQFERGGGAPARATPRHVGAVMAILATLQDGDALPPERSPDANRLIKALIQFQAAFMKSGSSALIQWFTEALREEFGDETTTALDGFRRDGWTSRTLQAVVRHERTDPPWDSRELAEALRAYNVGREDFGLMSQVVREASDHLAARGLTLHQVYESRRREMPGHD